ncbi:MAG: hypothetical protein ABSD70_12235 [Terracidiphilus sp.]
MQQKESEVEWVQSGPLIFSFTTMGLSALIGYLMFRKEPVRTILSRGAAFIEFALVFFFLGFSNLPLALPAVFGKIFGHPIDSLYVHPIQANGVQVSGTWWVECWLSPSRMVFLWLLLGGMIWAGLNILQRRSRTLNIVAVCSGVLLLGLHFLMQVMSFPF